MPKAVSTSGMMAAAAMGTANTASSGKVLTHHDRRDTHRAGEQQLVGFIAAFIRKAAHGQRQASKNSMTSVVEYKTVEKSDVPYTRQLAE